MTTPATDTAPKPRLGLWLGVVSIGAGIAMLVWVGWQTVGTNVIAQHRQEAAVTAIRQAWEADAPDPDTSEEGALLRIPRFGADWEMPILHGASDDNLASGVAHLSTSAEVGDTGNYALAAHRVTHGEPFRNLPELVAGDRVIVETRDTTYTYVLDTDGDSRTVDFADTWVLDDRPIPLPTRQVITLLTCAELFHTDDRLVVFGHLLSVVAKPAD